MRFVDGKECNGFGGVQLRQLIQKTRRRQLFWRNVNEIVGAL
jgi:hypothetical protein